MEERKKGCRFGMMSLSKIMTVFSFTSAYIFFCHFRNYKLLVKVSNYTLPTKPQAVHHMLVCKTARDCFIFLHCIDIFAIFRITSSLLFKVSNYMLLLTQLRPTSKRVSNDTSNAPHAEVHLTRTLQSTMRKHLFGYRTNARESTSALDQSPTKPQVSALITACRFNWK